jgi:hypothetical protein
MPRSLINPVAPSLGRLATPDEYGFYPTAAGQSQASAAAKAGALPYPVGQPGVPVNPTPEELAFFTTPTRNLWFSVGYSGSPTGGIQYYGLPEPSSQESQGGINYTLNGQPMTGEELGQYIAAHPATAGTTPITPPATTTTTGAGGNTPTAWTTPRFPGTSGSGVDDIFARGGSAGNLSGLLGKSSPYSNPFKK